MKHSPRDTSAFTLVETILSLTIIAIISTSIATLIAATGRATSYVTNTGDNVWQIENSARRMSYNLAMANSLDSPTTTTATNTFTIHTQPDPGNSNATYQVSYALSGTNLQETDTRYGTQTIAQNVTTFTVTRLSTSAPSTVQITITAGNITRTFTVMCRNV